MRAAKVISIIFGVLLVLIGVALFAPGGFLLGVYGTQRDDTGFFETSSRVVSTTGYALTTPDVDVNIGADLGNWIPTGARAEVRIRAASAGTGDLFIGIGPTDQVSQYLNGVALDEVTDYGWMSASVKYRHVDGGAPASPASQQDFWVARQEGPGSLALEWAVLDGNWTAVIMNSDGSAPVSASMSLGARFDLLLPIGIGLVIGGLVILAIGIVLIVLGARRRRPPLTDQPRYPERPAEPQYPGQPQYSGQPQYPVPPQPPAEPQYPAQPLTPAESQAPAQAQYPTEPQYPAQPTGGPPPQA